MVGRSAAKTKGRADVAYDLDIVKRHHPSQLEFIRTLQRLRVGTCQQGDVDYLLGLHLDDDRYSSDGRNILEWRSVSCSCFSLCVALTGHPAARTKGKTSVAGAAKTKGKVGGVRNPYVTRKGSKKAAVIQDRSSPTVPPNAPPIYVLFYERKSSYKKLECEADGVRFIDTFPEELRDELGVQLLEFPSVFEYNEFVNDLHSAKNQKDVPYTFSTPGTPATPPASYTVTKPKVTPDLPDAAVRLLSLRPAARPLLSTSPGSFSIAKPKAPPRQIDDDAMMPDMSLARGAAPKVDDDASEPSLPERKVQPSLHGHNGHFAASGLARSFRERADQQGMRLDVHYFPSVPATLFAMPILIDFVDQRSNFSHWLFRPGKLLEVVQAAASSPDGAKMDLGRFYKNMFITSIRHPHGTDLPHTKMHKTKAGTDLTITREGMVTFVNPSLTTDDLQALVTKKLSVFSDQAILQYCYKTAVVYEGANAAMAKELSPLMEGEDNGRFWRQWQGSLRAINLVPHASLPDLFVSSDRDKILSKLIPDLEPQRITPQGLPGPIGKFAF
jgi:hypothetical protein